MSPGTRISGQVNAAATCLGFGKEGCQGDGSMEVPGHRSWQGAHRQLALQLAELWLSQFRDCKTHTDLINGQSRGGRMLLGQCELVLALRGLLVRGAVLSFPKLGSTFPISLPAGRMCP